MRIVPPALVLHGRRHLRAYVFGGVFGTAVLGGCAKFPPAGANSNFTKVTFSMTVARQINLNYLYYVAIRSSVLVNPDIQNAPQPVYDPSKNPNGFVAGSPTQYVVFNALNELVQPFQLYEFATTAEVPNPSDPTNLINLAVSSPSTRGVITNFQQVNAGTNQNPGTSTTLSFSLFINMIPDLTAPAPTPANPNSQIPQTLQVQFLTLNTVGATSGRTYDFIGPPSTPQFLVIDLRRSGSYSNDTGPGTYLGIEPTGDCADPDLDITDWSVVVSTP
jgi:hypothetical protein